MKSQQSLKGTNWGQIVLAENQIQFGTVSDPSKLILDLKPSSITHVSNTAKDIIFHLRDDVEGGQQLAEVRFHYEHKQEQNEDDEESGKKSDASSKGMAKKICETIKKNYFKDKMDVDSLATFSDLSLAVPRGRYSVDFFPTFARFHGKTFSFSFNYGDVSKAFILPTENDSIIHLVLKLRGDRPVCQGQTVYPALIIQFNGYDQSQIEVKVTEKITAMHSHLDKLKKKYTGSTITNFSDIFKLVGQLSFIAPNPQQFSSKNKKTFLRCGIKAQQGWLYFLKKSILFTQKPIMYVKLEQIIKVTLSRLGLNNKQFDISIKLSGQKNKNIEFVGFDYQELEGVTQYFSKRGVKVEQQQPEKNAHKKRTGGQVVDEYDDDDESDGQFEVGEDEEDDSGSDENEDSLGSQKKSPKKVEKGKKIEKKLKKEK